MASQNQSLPVAKLPPNKLVSDDLDSSLANLVGNLGIGNGTTKNDVNWSQPGEKKLTEDLTGNQRLHQQLLGMLQQ